MKLAQNKPLVVGVGVIVVAVVAWLAFGVFGVHTLFTDTEVDEAGPSFASGVSSGVGDDVAEVMSSEEFKDAMDTAAENPLEVSDDPMPGEIVTQASGSFVGHTGHNVVGEALVLNDGTEQRFLRLEGFESTNGPDLDVYLRADDGEYVNLGDLKGNIGNQNYEIPPEVDLDRFNTVQIWCARFSVLFGDAGLA